MLWLSILSQRKFSTKTHVELTILVFDNFSKPYELIGPNSVPFASSIENECFKRNEVPFLFCPPPQPNFFLQVFWPPIMLYVIWIWSAVKVKKCQFKKKQRKICIIQVLNYSFSVIPFYSITTIKSTFGNINDDSNIHSGIH